jgi:hypothetical protein
MSTQSLQLTDVSNYLGTSPRLGALSLNAIERKSIVLSGSAGWGISESRDSHADWDIHIVVSVEQYGNLLSRNSDSATLVDNDHSPRVFIQMRPITWLRDRLLSNQEEVRILYLWLYTHCQFLCDGLDIQVLVEECGQQFTSRLCEEIRNHFVRFSVRRLDTSSAAKRGQWVAAQISCAEMVKAAMQTVCLLHSQPYPYNKWLPRFSSELEGDDGEVRLASSKCLCSKTAVELHAAAKLLQHCMETKVEAELGKQRWVSHWWEFNMN